MTLASEIMLSPLDTLTSFLLVQTLRVASEGKKRSIGVCEAGWGIMIYEMWNN